VKNFGGYQMIEKIEELRKIVSDAPESATHFADVGNVESISTRGGEFGGGVRKYYRRRSTCYFDVYFDGKWYEYYAMPSVIKIEHIKTIIAQHDEIERLREQLVNVFSNAEIPKNGKAGCIGEVEFKVEGANVCPECCISGSSQLCGLCHGESGEGGVSDLTVSVPWGVCKEIWLKINKIKAQEIIKETKNNDNTTATN
jgi:hypothetical protein